MLQREIQTVVTEFVRNLTSVIEAGVSVRTRENILRAFDGDGGATPRRVVSSGGATDATRGAGVAVRVRKKRAKVFCPVPRCKNVAAPVFGMVCGEHRHVAKRVIKRYRADRAARAAA